MNKTKFTQIMKCLNNTDKWFKIDSPEMLDIWYGYLKDLDGDLVQEIVDEWIMTKLPQTITIADIRKIAVEKTLNIVDPEVAWNLVKGGNIPREKWLQLPKAVRSAVENVGGTWALKTSEHPSIMRSQFLESYKHIIEQQKNMAATGKIKLLKE